MGGFSGGGASNPFGPEVDLSEMQQIATARLIGNISGGNAVPSALTLANVLSFLGTGTPGSGNYLRGDGSWQAITSGKLLQIQYSIDGAVATGSTAIPNDDSIPQLTNEGTLFYSVSITPIAATSRLLIWPFLNYAGTSTVANILAVFVDSTENAIHWLSDANAFANFQQVVSAPFIVSAGSTSARTYKLKAGPTSGTMTVNGFSSGRKGGGVGASGIIVMEIAA